MNMELRWLTIGALILSISASVHSFAIFAKHGYSPRPGQCPPHIQSFPSSFGCSCDDECPADHKCCEYLCGPVCVPPVFIKAECPDTYGMVGPCVELCSDDCDCLEGRKCCSNGCGHECTIPKIVKPGYCNPFHLIPCGQPCHDDGHCPGEEKCCPTLCGHSCKNPFRFIKK